MSQTEFTMVVAEDEPPILANLVRKIEALGMPVRIVGIAGDGLRALAMVAGYSAHRHTDARPGWAVVVRLPGTKMLILTDYSEFEYARKALNCQVSGYLLKPVKVEQLHQALKQVCGELEQARAAIELQEFTELLHGQTPTLPRLVEEPAGQYLLCAGNLLYHCGQVDPQPYLDRGGAGAA